MIVMMMSPSVATLAQNVVRRRKIVRVPYKKRLQSILGLLA